MGRKRRAAALALAYVAAAACNKKETAPAVQPAAPRIALVQKFSPPLGGLLTDRQIDRFIAVRRAARGRTEADAARALGVDPDEHAWVRARLIEATVALDERRIRASSSETYARTIAQLHETRMSVRDAVTLRTIDEQIAALEKERAAWKKLDPPPPAIAANARRVEKRRAEIDAAAP